MVTQSTFVGWIPTILGRLSWTKIGAIDQRGRVTRVPRGENQAFVVRQTRKLDDGLFPTVQSLIRWLITFYNRGFFQTEHPQAAYEVSNQFNFYLIASRDKSGEQLKGWIACVTSANDPLHKNFNDASRDPTQSGSYASKLNSEFPNFIERHNSEIASTDHLRYRSRSIRLMAFTMFRNGITEITPLIDPILSDDERRLVAQQSFYFLKDISHIHQHHSESSECQFLLHPKADTLCWATEILKDLQRAVITARRARDDLESLHDAVGISHYAQTFESICKSENYSVPQLEWKHLQDSVHAVSAKWHHYSAIADRNFTGLLGTLALIIGLCGSYHILFAAENLGSTKLTGSVLPPIAFLSHRLFEWDVVNPTNRILTILLWAGIATTFVIGMSRTVRKFVYSAWQVLVDIAVRIQITSPRFIIHARIIASLVSAAILALALYIAWFGLSLLAQP